MPTDHSLQYLLQKQTESHIVIAIPIPNTNTKNFLPHSPLLKKVENEKFYKFITMLKQLSVNIFLGDALEEMQRYAKFMKDLTTKKRSVSYETENVTHHCSSSVINLLI